MIRTSSDKTYWKLEAAFKRQSLHRPMHLDRFEEGTDLEYRITAVNGRNTGVVRLLIEKFVGGGFAGQVYRVKVIDVQPDAGPLEGIQTGKVLAMKILIPPTAFSRTFRNVIYWVGFQGPFQLQVNPAASRSGAIWQKFIRRAAKIRFGDEQAVVDIHATFIDEKLGSCGELSEWIDGRTWRHELGAHEFARQYEWSTCKSQPNCLKRTGTDDSPSGGLVAVDFRAGLALLPFLPMSPGDFKLIAKGLLRGSLVQFDRGDISKLEKFIQAHPDTFSDMDDMLEELKAAEHVYRDSVPDITHNNFRLLYDLRLWSTMIHSAITGWKVRNFITIGCEEKLRRNRVFALLFSITGILPLAGRFIRRLWCSPDYREHYRGMLSSWNYFLRAVRGRCIEKIIGWHRAGRVNDDRSVKLAAHVWRCCYHMPLSILPAGLHRFFTDLTYAKERFDYLAVRPVRLYFNADLRSQWLRDMVMEGEKKHLLSKEDAAVIRAQTSEPFIQKYLQSLAVHICTVPITQVVSFTIAIIYVATHPEMPRMQAYAIGLSIIALFQVVPISPGSLARGLYVVYLVIRERNFRDYNIAVFLGFLKYVGYLAFPIQMAYRYPAIARFMAGHWATDAVHIVPVFGERGALLEHSIFCRFYNWPLTIRRRMKERREIRASMKSRYWHIVFYALFGAGIFAIADYASIGEVQQFASLKKVWYIAMFGPLMCGGLVTLGAGGASLSKRITGGIVCGILIGAVSAVIPSIIGYGSSLRISDMISNGIWRAFVCSIMSLFGVIMTEMKLPGSGEPCQNRKKTA
jgi:hypothetical protein